jgi:hypothetical protein
VDGFYPAIAKASADARLGRVNLSYSLAQTRRADNERLVQVYRRLVQCGDVPRAQGRPLQPVDLPRQRIGVERTARLPALDERDQCRLYFFL